MQQQGGSPYGVPPPEMASFSSPTAPGPGPRSHILGIPPAADQQMAEAASPISSRPPPPPPPAAAAPGGAPGSAGSGFEELVPGAGGGGFPDDEGLAGAGDEADRGGGGGAGNRWPKQETLALIKIRSEMDTVFREATLKGPLWEEVSRKLGELGYRRSAKKCKEKFENVHKYYKRTKENRAGRQDGKSYRFFSQLEALGAASSSGGPAAAAGVPTPSPTTIGFAAATAGPSAPRMQPTPISAAAPPPNVTPVRAATEIGHASAFQGISGSTTPTTPAAAAVGGISFSTNSSSSESDDTEEDEETEETGGQPERGKRKRKGGSAAGGGGGGGGSRKMMVFFEGLMKQVVERQEVMQQRFLETIEKREQDRMIREEAWRRQEMTRLTREQELMAQERAMAASRDAAVLSFIQKISGQTIQLPAVPATPISASPAPADPAPAPVPQPQRQSQHRPPPVPPQPQPQPQREFRQHQQSTEIVLHQASTSSHELVPVPDPHESAPGATGFETASSSRWPKSEVHALINLRSGLDIKYQEAGPKGPLWEDISAEMKRLGYNRSSKRCKEKWENINKYFKKVKESNKKRPEDSKTCPYFHQLEALYRRKQQGIVGSSSGSGHRPGDQEAYSHSNPQGQSNVLSIMPPPPPPPPPPPLQSSQPPPSEAETKTDGGKKNGESSDGNGGGSGGVQIQTSNGGLTPTLFEEGPTKKPEDIVKELMDRRDAADDCDEADDSYNMDGQDYDEDDDDDDDDEEDDEDEEGSKMRYEIQFQRPSNVSGGGGNASTAAAAAAPTNTTTTTTTGSFLAMVQ